MNRLMATFVTLSVIALGFVPTASADVVRVEVEGLGALENEIVRGPAPIRDDVGAQPTSTEEVMSTALGGDWEFRGIRAPRKS